MLNLLFVLLLLKMISGIAALGSSFSQAQERVTKLTKDGQDSVINASLIYLKEKAKLKVSYFLNLLILTHFCPIKNYEIN